MSNIKWTVKFSTIIFIISWTSVMSLVLEGSRIMGAPTHPDAVTGEIYLYNIKGISHFVTITNVRIVEISMVLFLVSFPISMFIILLKRGFLEKDRGE